MKTSINFIAITLSFFIFYSCKEDKKHVEANRIVKEWGENHSIPSYSIVLSWCRFLVLFSSKN
jgi:hypothetical protein